MNAIKYLQLIPPLLFIVVALFLLTWLILLILCLRKREFYPIIGGTAATRWFWLATFVFVNPMLLILYLVFGQFRSAKKPPRLAARFAIAGGVAAVVALGFCSWLPLGRHLWMQWGSGLESSGPSWLNASVAAIQSSNQTSTGSSTSSNNHSSMACRSVWLAAADNDPLTARICRQLEEKLPTLSPIASAQWLRQMPPTGQRNPDIWLQVRVANCQPCSAPGTRSLKAEIQVSAFQGQWGCRSFYFDNNTLPEVNFNWNCTLTHDSVTTGYESHPFTLAVNDIASQIADSLQKFIKSQLEKDGLMPEFPDTLYPAWQPTELPAALRDRQAAVILSIRRLMVPNETFFCLDLAEPVAEMLNQIGAELEQAGWNLGSRQTENTSFIDIRANHSNQVLQLYDIRPEDEKSNGLAFLAGSPLPPSGCKRFYGYYRQLLTEEEKRSVLQHCLDCALPIDQLMVLEDQFARLLPDQFFARLQQEKTDSLPVLVQLAQYYQRHDRQDEARLALKKAIVMQQLEPQGDNFKSSLESLAKDLGDADLTNRDPDQETLHLLGAVALPLENNPLELQLPWSRPLILYHRNQAGELATWMLRPQWDDATNPPTGKMYQTEHRTSSKSWSTETMQKNESGWFGLRAIYFDQSSPQQLIQINYQSDGNQQMTYKISRAD